MKKKLLTSAEELKKIISEFKRTKKDSLTNYIPNSALHNKWAQSGNAVIYAFDDGVFITHDKGVMLETIFISDSRENITRCLEVINNDSGKNVVVERVFREGKDKQIGNPDYILRRMIRIENRDEIKSPSERVEKASVKDINGIREIFTEHFNPLTERIPDNEELERLIKMNGISVVRNSERIIGMIIYEKNPTSIHLRYWWVSPTQRNKGIGADLLRDYFLAGQNCKLQFLWVFSDNNDAISKYRHYGFDFDGIADEIYITQ